MRSPIAKTSASWPIRRNSHRSTIRSLERRVAHEERGARGGQEDADEHPHEALGEEPLARGGPDDDLVAQGVGDGRAPGSGGLAARRLRTVQRVLIAGMHVGRFLSMHARVDGRSYQSIPSVDTGRKGPMAPSRHSHRSQDASTIGAFLSRVGSRDTRGRHDVPVRRDGLPRRRPALPRPADGREDGAAAIRREPAGLEHVDAVLPGRAARRIRSDPLHLEPSGTASTRVVPGRPSRPSPRGAADRVARVRPAEGRCRPGRVAAWSCWACRWPCRSSSSR